MPLPRCAVKWIPWESRTNLPALGASAGCSSTSRFEGERPKVLSPLSSQDNPTRVSHPCSPVNSATRVARHCSTMFCSVAPSIGPAPGSSAAAVHGLHATRAAHTKAKNLVILLPCTILVTSGLAHILAWGNDCMYWRPITSTMASAAAALLLTGIGHAQTEPSNALARDIFKELVEINTTESVGNVTAASEAMAQRLRAAGFPAEAIPILGPNDRKKNLVVRLHGSGKHKPVLLIGHLDVVEARREDWTADPFKFLEKDGYFFGRGTQDMKSGDAIMATTLIRFKKEGFVP